MVAQLKHSQTKVRVKNVRSKGEHGGVLFTGYELDDNNNIIDASKYIVVNVKHGQTNIVHRNEVWEVQGIYSVRAGNNNGFEYTEDVIEANEIKLLHESGDNFVDELWKNDEYKGIGQVYAQSIWDMYGERAFDIMDQCDIDSLIKVIREDVAINACNVWKTKGLSKLIRWLHLMNIPSKAGSSIVAVYGEMTKDKVEENPYRLIPFSVSWNVVDKLAQDKFEIEEDSPLRLAAAIEEACYSKFESSENKNTVFKLSELQNSVTTLLGSSILADKAINESNGSGFYRNDNLIHPAGCYLREQYIVERITSMIKDGKRMPFNNSCQTKLDEFSLSLEYDLTDEQKKAVVKAVTNEFTVVTGGAGVGKTTVLKAIYHLMDYVGYTVFQVALAGRAAKRMSESSGREAMTICGFLKKFSNGDLKEATCLVVDEASMVDLAGAYRLFKRLPFGSKLILVGDPVQLPPIGAGLLFHPLANTSLIGEHKASLTKTMRQCESTGIPSIATSIRNHNWSELPDYIGANVGVSFLRCHESDMIQKINSIYGDLGGDYTDTIILSSNKTSGKACANNINKNLQNIYRDGEPLAYYWDMYLDMAVWSEYKLNDHVMFNRNDYKREIMNGTLGKVVKVENPEPGKEHFMDVNFEGIIHEMTIEDINDISLAYSITVHKSQGSQFERVIIPVYKSRLLDHSLVYTALTRAVMQVVFVGNEDIAREAVESKSSVSYRRVGLEKMLNDALRIL